MHLCPFPFADMVKGESFKIIRASVVRGDGKLRHGVRVSDRHIGIGDFKKCIKGFPVLESKGFLSLVCCPSKILRQGAKLFHMILLRLRFQLRLMLPAVMRN